MIFKVKKVPLSFYWDWDVKNSKLIAIQETTDGRVHYEPFCYVVFDHWKNTFIDITEDDNYIYFNVK